MDQLTAILLEFYSKLNPSDLDLLFLITKLPFCLLSGLLVCYVNSYKSFPWLRNSLNLYVGGMLPVLGLVITVVIGSNIALSLGMIGALSIIRFRTPVRSSYELTIYFLLLTIGIAAKVHLGVSITLTIVGCLFLPIISFFNKTLKKETETGKHINLNMIINFEQLKNLLKNENLADLSVVKINDKSEYEININISFLTNQEEISFINEWKLQIVKLNVFKENKIL